MAPTFDTHLSMLNGVPLHSIEPEGRFAHQGVSLRTCNSNPFDFVEQLQQLLPHAGKIKALAVGKWAEDLYDLDPFEIVEELVENADALTSLESVFIADLIHSECPLEEIEQADLSPLLRAFPKLKNLTVRGTNGLSLHDVDHQGLESLTIQSHGLDATLVRQLGRVRLPSLCQLELWLGGADTGATYTPDDFEPLLKGTGTPKLKALTLREVGPVDAMRALTEHAPLAAWCNISVHSLGDEA